MKYLKYVLMLAMTLAAHAHDGHVHEPAIEAPPHGGLLRDAGPFKSEVIVDGDELKVYIYRKTGKELKLVSPDRDTLSGDYQLPKQKKGTPVEFKRQGDFYAAKVPGISKAHRFDLHVHLVVGKEKGLADFGVDNIQ